MTFATLLSAGWPALRPWLVLAAAAAWIGGCGGSVGAEGTGTGYVAGPVSGFGSIIVGGVRFADDQATIEDEDGAALPRTMLRLGMTVEVDSGEILPAIGGSSATASRVRIVTSVLGPVSAIDPSGRHLTILGQPVQVQPSTTVESSLPGGVAYIRVGDVVCIYGLVDAATGAAIATRITPYASAPAYRMRGVASAVDPVAQTFRIDGETFSYAAAGAPAGLAEGAFVRVRFATARDTLGRWPLLGSSTAVRIPADGTDATIQGRVGGLADAAHFRVDGVPVDASAALFDPGPGGLTEGARVEAAGRMAGGVLRASVVRIVGPSGPGVFQVAGAIASADAAARTFVVQRTLIEHDAATTFVGGSASELLPGRAVAVEGALTADGTRLLADRITFR